MKDTHNDTPHNDTPHNDTPHNDTQQNDYDMWEDEDILQMAAEYQERENRWQQENEEWQKWVREASTL